MERVVVKQGTLQKKGQSTLSGWKSRYLVLYGQSAPALMVFDDERQFRTAPQHPKAVVDMRNAVIDQVSPSAASALWALGGESRRLFSFYVQALNGPKVAGITRRAL
jgi:hypothetical protein